jgi:hypothetical protein
MSWLAFLTCRELSTITASILNVSFVKLLAKGKNDYPDCVVMYEDFILLIE